MNIIHGMNILDTFRKFFPDTEILCRCGRKDCDAPKLMHPVFAEKVLNTRIAFGEPMQIISGIRCLHWNTHHKGSDKSFHMTAEAVDVYSRGAAYNARLITCAIANGILGIGVRGGAKTRGIVHLDNRAPSHGKPEIFGY